MGTLIQYVTGIYCSRPHTAAKRQMRYLQMQVLRTEARKADQGRERGRPEEAMVK